MKGLIIVVIALAILVAAAAAAYQHYSIQPLFPAKPSPIQHALPSPQPRAVIALDTATPTPSPNLLPGQAVVSFPGPNNDIIAIIPAPGDQLVLVLTGNGEEESYSLKINLVDLRAKVPKMTEVVAGSNAVDFTNPVWSADSRHIYYEFDSGCFPGGGSCGIYEYDVATGKSRRVIERPTAGLTVSSDSQLLAFWDFTLGDVLTVYSIPKKQVLRRWEKQPHTAGEFFLKEMAFASDGKSLLATTSDANRWPLKEFDLENGETRTVSQNASSGPLVTPQGVYFVEADEYKQGVEVRSRLMRISQTGAQPELVLANFPYSIQPGGDPRWIAANRGSWTMLYDTQAGSRRSVGPDCRQGAVLSDGRALYGFKGTLVEDTKICGTPTPESPSF